MVPDRKKSICIENAVPFLRLLSSHLGSAVDQLIFQQPEGQYPPGNWHIPYQPALLSR